MGPRESSGRLGRAVFAFCRIRVAMIGLPLPRRFALQRQLGFQPFRRNQLVLIYIAVNLVSAEPRAA